MEFNKIKNPVIYLITNKINGKQYVGKSINFKNRYLKHKYAKYYNTYLHNSIRKYGFENFEFKILEQDIEINILQARENYYIDKYDTLNNGYNLRKDSKDNSGWKHSEETKKKISKSSSGRKFPDRVRVNWEWSEEGKKSFNKKMSGGNNPNAKRVYQYDKKYNLINIYPSVSIAAKELNFNAEGIGLCARGKKNYYKGFKWTYFPLSPS